MGRPITGLLLLATSSAAVHAQSAPTQLPAIEVITSPAKQKKYPAAKASPKKKPASAPVATSVAPAAASSPAPAATVPGVAVVGDIIGSRNGDLALQGSGQVVTGEELYTSHVFTTNEALRKVPGVHVRDEEGFGMRPNIGIRGLNPTRSTKTLLLEDGLFLTYAPYGDNASYFHPLMDRYDHVEVIKGTDLLRFGPHTISGAVNYVTPNPPREPGGFVALTGGNRDYFNGQFFAGGWVGDAGALVDAVHKRGKGARDNTEHEITDVGVKGIALVNPDSAFVAKFSYFKEDSTVTYSGITDAELRNFGIRYNPFKNDTFNTERYGTSLVHNWDITDDLTVTSAVYYNTFSRDWWRQSSRTTDGQCGAAFTNARLAGQAVNVDACNSIQGRLRDYESYGWDQRAAFEYDLGAVESTLKAGYRVHTEYQDRLQINRLPITGGYTLAESSERDAFAVSYFLENRFEWGAFSVTPAVRVENIDYERVTRASGTAGCTRAPCRGEFDVSETIPGISVGFDPLPGLAFFAGVHEGFAPPRVEDAITGAGGSLDLDAENSTNIEVGMRSQPVKGFKLDATYFRNDFDNLIAVGSVAGGDQPLAQGEALFEGGELLTRLESGPFVGTTWSVYSQVAWTYLWEAEQSTAFRSVTTGLPVQGNTAGNRQPYAPEHLVTARIGYTQKNFDVNLEMVYVGSQYADFLNLEAGALHPNGPASAEARSGQFGKIDAYTIFNLGMTYTIEPTETDLYFTVKNLFDDEYIVDRTRGILPGGPRLFQVGVKQSF